LAYSGLAYFYDIFTKEINYKKMADRVEGIFKKCKAAPKLILDLACGTGSLTLELKSRGYDLIGLDLSAEMLSVAQNKAYDMGFGDILFLKQNMTSFDLYGTVDAILCSLDGINHLLKKEDVLKCFERAALFLNDGGLFIFDINTPKKFKTLYGNNSYIFEDDNVFCGWQNAYNDKTKINTFHFSFFYEQDGVYNRLDDICKEKAYEIEEITELLEQANFKLLSIVGGEIGYKKYKDGDLRAVFTAKKG
jgi:ubiquinone/menaquinone biosynthesis C-methylase UbiE